MRPMKPSKTMWLGLWLVACTVLAWQPAQAETTYSEPDLVAMYDILFANGFINPDQPQELIDYVRAKDCTLYQRYYTNDFAWNKIKTRLVNEAKTLQKNVPMHFVIYDQFNLERYNFKTQSFNLTPDNQLKNIMRMTLIPAATYMCQGKPVNYPDKVLPTSFDFQMDVPLSLYRIPMAESMARRILPDMINAATTDIRAQRAKQSRVIYANLYLTIDGVQGISRGSALLGGRLDRIEFFLDPQRTQRIKTFLYNTASS